MARGTTTTGRVQTTADPIPTTVTCSLSVTHNPQGVCNMKQLLPQRAALSLCLR